MRQRIVMKGEVLVLAHTPNDAKQIEAHLRTSGHNVHVLVAPGLDSFADIIEKSDICIAVHDAEFSECRLIQLVEAVHRHKPQIPVMQLSNNSDTRSVTDAMAQGARGIVSLGNLPHLEMLFQQEYELYAMHEELQGLRDKIAELERVRTQDLGSTSAPGLRVQEGIVVHANQALAEALRFSDPEDLIGYPLMDLVASQDQKTVKDAVKAVMKGRLDDSPVGFTLSSDSGATKRLDARFIRIEHDGEPAIEIRGQESRGPAGDTSKDASVARQGLIAAIHEQALTSIGDAVASLIFVGLDDYAGLEQRAGYDGAEQVAEQAIDIIRETSRENDKLFRFSLSEMVVLGYRDSLDDMHSNLEHFQRTLARHVFKAGNKEVTCTASVVIYPLASDPEDPQTLLSKLHNQTQDIQSKGGNTITIAGDTAEELKLKEQQAMWAAKVKKALSDNRFDLAYQNIASLAGEERQFSDILLRMIDEDGEEVVARNFMPAAEASGLMPHIDRWVVQRAAQVISKQLSEHRDPCFFVRVAESTLADSDKFIAWLKPFVEKNAFLQNHMVLVIREKHLQDHIARAQNLVNTAQELGLATALDHFGTNRQSHQMLERLKVGYIKLHSDFTESIGKAGADMQALEAIMEYAKQHGVKTIAERVTDANGMARLWQMGVNYIMGSHVHEPDRELRRTNFALS